MNFTTKKISKTKVQKIPKVKKQFGKKHKITASIIVSIAIILLLGVGIVKAISSIDFKLFLSAAGEELLQDQYGNTNFLLLGTGGKNHEGSDLTDTILVASLNEEKKTISMISLPRDLYIKDEIVGSSRINEVYYYAKQEYADSALAIDHLKKKIEETLGTEIQYWAMVNFDGFKEIIDIIGGIDVNVENAIYDPYYPKDGTYLYETFSISAGLHHLDGETALKYARSRKTTSDFDRAKRQQDIIFSIKERALETEILFSSEKISEILNTVKENIQTNIKITEILTLGSIAADYSKDQINHKLLHDDQYSCGGFLYTPRRDLYNGMFVLIPAGNLDFIHRYTDLNFNYSNIKAENTKLHILNGTKTGGIAGEIKQILQRYCFDIARFGNATTQDILNTKYYYKQKLDEKGKPIDSRPPALDFLKKLIPGIETTEIPMEYNEYFLESDILIEIGSDYTESPNYIDDPFYSLYDYETYDTPAATPTTTSTTPESTEPTTIETAPAVETPTIETPAVETPATPTATE